MSIIESHSIYLVYDLMDACNLCIWLRWSPAVYFWYTRWRIIKFLNKISFTYQKKKKGYLYKVVNCVNWVNLGLIGHAWEGRSHHHCMQRPEQQRSHLAARQSLQLMMVRVLESDLGWEENVLRVPKLLNWPVSRFLCIFHSKPKNKRNQHEIKLIICKQ